jgi:hypothetical protein
MALEGHLVFCPDCNMPSLWLAHDPDGRFRALLELIGGPREITILIEEDPKVCAFCGAGVRFLSEFGEDFPPMIISDMRGECLSLSEMTSGSYGR